VSLIGVHNFGCWNSPPLLHSDWLLSVSLVRNITSLTATVPSLKQTPSSLKKISLSRNYHKCDHLQGKLIYALLMAAATVYLTLYGGKIGLLHERDLIKIGQYSHKTMLRVWLGWENPDDVCSTLSPMRSYTMFQVLFRVLTNKYCRRHGLIAFQLSFTFQIRFQKPMVKTSHLLKNLADFWCG